jgi:hypothetical protein
VVCCCEREFLFLPLNRRRRFGRVAAVDDELYSLHRALAQRAQAVHAVRLHAVQGDERLLQLVVR